MYLYKILQKLFLVKQVNFKFFASSFCLSSFFLLVSFNLFSQKTINEVIEKYNDGSVAYISVEELTNLSSRNSKVRLLDARSFEEYQVSHLENAQHIGYKDFDIEKVEKQFKKDETLVVYCSIGVRSEEIGEQLQNAGYQKVYNLYGGIFEWFNENQPIYNKANQKTNRIHAYSTFWGSFVNRGEKVYE